VLCPSIPCTQPLIFYSAAAPFVLVPVYPRTGYSTSTLFTWNIFSLPILFISPFLSLFAMHPIKGLVWQSCNPVPSKEIPHHLGCGGRRAHLEFRVQVCMRSICDCLLFLKQEQTTKNGRVEVRRDAGSSFCPCWL
jgi:hypothetical protein